jgi:hypothetical protein
MKVHPKDAWFRSLVVVVATYCGLACSAKGGATARRGTDPVVDGGFQDAAPISDDATLSGHPHDGSSANGGKDAASDQRARGDVILPPEESRPCGAPGQPCCDGLMCQGGGCCVRCQCVAPGASCGLVPGTCSAGSCGTCGGIGQACCPADRCTAANAMCQEGRCQACGLLGQWCCFSSICTEPDTACAVGCQKCGEPGGPCCPGETCHGDGCCFENRCVPSGGPCMSGGPAGNQGTCAAGRCSGCGTLGAACCGDHCLDGMSCEDRVCTLCGGLGEPCCPAARCAAPLLCSNVGCVACGGPGQPCCRGSEPCAAGGLHRKHVRG